MDESRTYASDAFYANIKAFKTPEDSNENAFHYLLTQH